MPIKETNNYIINNIKTVIYSNSFNSLIKRERLSKKQNSTVIGIGGSHIYFSKLSGLKIERTHKERINFKDKDKFFENIIYKYNEEKFQNKNTIVIFSYPFRAYRKDTIIDGIYKKNTEVTKVIPFKDDTFNLSDKLNSNFNIVNDAVAVNLYNIYKYSGYDIYISAISGTGVNIAYTQDNLVINSEYGNIQIPKDIISLTNIFSNSTFESVIAENSLRKISKIKDIDYKYLKKISAKIFALSIVSFISDYKSASVLFQGSFICKDKEYRDRVISIIKANYKGHIHIDYDNLSDIKGASLI
jgi:hypothetical protein